MKVQTLLVSRDLTKTKAFYKALFQAHVILDYGANITLTGGISFQTLESWCTFIQKPKSDIIFAHHTAELYYECDDLDAFIKKAEEAHVIFVHQLQTHSWGQRGIRIYDPDKHIIEVSEPLYITVKRMFHEDHMSIKDIMKTSGLSEAMTKRFLNHK